MIKKILIVDDSPIARKILKKCIPSDRDYEFYEAGDGLAGLNKFKEINPDIVFLDLTMPVMDGMQALEEIRKVKEEAIVIVVTADIQVKSLFKVLELGALMMLRKPLSKEMVEDALLKAGETLKNMR